jgi:hypothetical protein
LLETCSIRDTGQAMTVLATNIRSGGCKSFYFQYYCGPGCTSGECQNNGGGGLCCGHQYDDAVIYPDGGECGPGRVRAPCVRP